MDAQTYLRTLVSDLNHRTGIASRVEGPNGVSFQSGGYSVVLDATSIDRISIRLLSSEVQNISVLPGDSPLAVSSGGAEADAKSAAEWAKVLAKWLKKGKSD